MIGCKTS